jgi:hypothetical protein
MRLVAILLAAAALTGCYGDIDKSDPRYAEMERNSAWMKKLKAEDRPTAELLAQECYDEGGSLMSAEGLLQLTRCMRRKYDEGVRWVPEEA